MAAGSVPKHRSMQSRRLPQLAGGFYLREGAFICRLVAFMAVIGLAEGFLTLPSRIQGGCASAQPGLRQRGRCGVAGRAFPRVSARRVDGTSEIRRLRVSCSQTKGAGGVDLVQEAIDKCRAAVEAKPEYKPRPPHVDLYPEP